MKRGVLILSLFMTLSPLALFCEVQTYRGIECGNLDIERCQETIDQNIPESMLSTIEFIQNEQMSLIPNVTMPNCYWTVLAFLNFIDRTVLRYIDDFEFEDILKKDFVDIPENELQPGDLVVPWLHYDLVAIDHDSQNRPIRLYSKNRKRPFHAAIYLGEVQGNGIFFQKHDRWNSVFSLTTLDSIFKVYNQMISSGFNGAYQNKYLKDQFYRLK